MALRQPHDDKAVVSRASEAIELAEVAGLYLDDWQCDVLESMCSVRDENFWCEALERYEPRWAANEYGVVVARQNGKGAIIEARSLAGLFLWGEEQIVYTAHHGRTMVQMFKRMRLLTERLVKRDRDAREMLGNVLAGNGREGIYMKDGREMLFMARSKSSIRGLSCDTLILDEAMEKLETEEIEAARPAVSARPNYQILDLGSAGTEESEYFGAVRTKIMKVFDLGVKFHELSPRTGWSEWSCELHTDYCDADCDLHDDPADPQTWAKTNPSLGIRLDIETIEDEIDTMTPGGFAKERLSVGRWPVEGGGWKVIPKDIWEERGLHDLAVGDKFCLAVDSAPDEAWTCITACGATQDPEKALAEITADAETDELDYRPGVNWALDRIVKIYKATKFAFVAIDPASPAGVLIPKLEAKHIPIKEITGRAANHACGEFLRALHPKKGEPYTLVHSNQAPMTTAAANAEKKDRVELWSWDKLTESADITPITSATKAYGAYMAHLYRKKATPFFFIAE